MQLRENLRPVWTERHLDMVERYGELCFGQSFSPEVFEAERAAVAVGSPGLRADPVAQVYDVYSDSDELAGELALTRRRGCVELHVMVFDEFAGGHIATDAIRRAITMLKLRGELCIEAAVRLQSPNRDQMDHILRGLGFVRQEPTPPAVVYRYGMSRLAI